MSRSRLRQPSSGVLLAVGAGRRWYVVGYVGALGAVTVASLLIGLVLGLWAP